MAATLAEHFGTTAARQIDGEVRLRIREMALAPDGVHHLAGGFRADAIRAGDLGITWRVRSAGTAATGQVVLAFRMVAAIFATIILGTYSWLLALFLLATSLTVRAIVRRHLLYMARVGDEAADSQRQADYWAELASGPAAAKEVRVFGLAGWALGKRWKLHHAWVENNTRARLSILRRQGTTVALVVASALAALLVPTLAMRSGNLSTGGLATCLIAAFAIFQIGSMGYEAFDIEYGAEAVRALDRMESRYRATVPPASPAVAAQAAATPPVIAIRDLTFRYPGAAAPVLHDLTLDIRPGEVLGLVGVNGAGKSTLMRLLAAVHQPESGSILVDGKPLPELDTAQWRRRLAFVLQEFVRYPGTLGDNVSLAAPDHTVDQADIEDVLALAGLSDKTASLPQGIETPLWAGAGGADLSGGQWQRVAVARALYAARHGRQVIVLDEPTAQLDVAAEVDFYDRVVTSVASTVILISHRLATVRRADRIAVLRDGRVGECGSHTELMALDGEYARLFRLQAGRFDEQSHAGAEK
ncbi:ATP-binding cassette domain-containing protein [Streptomyces tendae]|uniref:ATP-binding cassette domain-containing protein n=1 Tax=Streptomyces tendae TaxID=1932 RepID=UPI0033EC73FF